MEDGNGFGVWRRLRPEAEPTTSAGALRAIVDVVVRKKVADVLNILQELTEWEVTVVTVERDHGEVVSQRMRWR